MEEASAVEAAVVELYSNPAPGRIGELNARLCDFTTSSNVVPVALALLRSQRGGSVQFFGANALYEVLCKRWALVAESGPAFAEIRATLVQRLEEREERKPLAAKLSASLALLAAQAVPDLWERPLEELLERWLPGKPLPLMRFLGAVPGELRRIPELRRREHVRRLVLGWNGTVAACLVRVLGAPGAEPEFPLVLVACLDAWLDLPTLDKDAWQQAASQALDFLVAGRHIEQVGELLGKLAEQSEGSSDAAYRSGLFRFAATHIAPFIMAQLNSLDSDGETLLKAIITLAETHARYMIRLLINPSANPEEEGWARAIVDLLLRTTTLEGSYTLDESVSDLTATFWYQLYEESRDEDSALVMPVLGPVYTTLLSLVLPKLCLPHFTSLSKEAQEDYESYRETMGEVVLSCHRVLGETAAAIVLAKITASIGSGDVVEGEAALFAFTALAEYADAESPATRQLLLHSLHALPGLLSDSQTAITALKLLGSLSHLVVTMEGRESALPLAVTAALKLLAAAETAPAATQALHSLLGHREPLVRSVPAETALESLHGTFSRGDLEERTRLRALECAGYFLSVQDEAVIVSFLQTTLLPRLDKVREMCGGGDAVDKATLLFEIKVIAALVSTLERPQAGEGELKPVASVMEHSLPIFSALIHASGNDADVAESISSCLKGGLLGLADADKGKALVPGIVKLLGSMFPPNISALAPAKQLITLYAGDEGLAPHLAALLAAWARPESLYSSSGTPEPESAEALLGLGTGVLKRSPGLLASSGALGGLLQAASQVLTDEAAFREAPPLKQACLFLAAALNGHVQMEEWTEDLGGLLSACFSRIRNEVLTSSVEYVADVALCVFARHAMPAQRHLAATAQLRPEEEKLISAMLASLGNKRKFREHAKRINIFARSQVQRP